jgi:hypothetical protein
MNKPDEIIELLQRYCIRFNVHIPFKFDYDRLGYLSPNFSAHELIAIINTKENYLMVIIHNNYLYSNEKHYQRLPLSSLARLIRTNTLKELLI